MSRRADHYVWAGELIWSTRRTLKNADLTPFEHSIVELLAAIGHATLAAAGPGVEAEVEQNERAAAAAVAATEGTQRERQAARPPLPMRLTKVDPAQDDRPPVCMACGHKHDGRASCAGHKWRDSCPYVGTDCDRPKPGPPPGGAR